MQLDNAIKTRKSVRKFKDKKPNWRKIITAIDSSRYAPMAGGNFTLRFILVDDKNKINKIADACQQDFVKTAHYVVVACSHPSMTITSYGKKGEIYSRQQAGAGIQNFLLKINELGLSSCWVGHFVESQIKDLLKMSSDVNVEAVLPVGYEYSKEKTKSKIDLDRILFFNKYKNKKMKDVKIVRV